MFVRSCRLGLSRVAHGCRLLMSVLRYVSSVAADAASGSWQLRVRARRIDEWGSCCIKWFDRCPSGPLYVVGRQLAAWILRARAGDFRGYCLRLLLVFGRFSVCAVRRLVGCAVVCLRGSVSVRAALLGAGTFAIVHCAGLLSRWPGRRSRLMTVVSRMFARCWGVSPGFQVLSVIGGCGFIALSCVMVALVCVRASAV